MLLHNLGVQRHPRRLGAMTRRVKVSGDLFHGPIPDGAVYVGRYASPRTPTHTQSRSTGWPTRCCAAGCTSKGST
jgi:hypothetical protein